MFDIGMSELLLIGIVALIVVGPKDLPQLFHTLGRITARARQLGREFSRAMNEAARESGVDDVAKGLKGAANPSKFGMDKLSEAADRFEKWDPSKPSQKPSGPKGKPPEHGRTESISGSDTPEVEAKAEAGAQEPAAAEKAAPAKAKKPAAKSTSAKSTSAKSTSAKSTSTKSTAAKSGASKSAATKAPAKSAEKPAATSKSKAATAKKPAAKPAAKKTAAAKKPAAKKPAGKAAKASTTTKASE